MLFPLLRVTVNPCVCLWLYALVSFAEMGTLGFEVFIPVTLNEASESSLIVSSSAY